MSVASQARSNAQNSQKNQAATRIAAAGQRRNAAVAQNRATANQRLSGAAQAKNNQRLNSAAQANDNKRLLGAAQGKATRGARTNSAPQRQVGAAQQTARP